MGRGVGAAGGAPSQSEPDAVWLRPVPCALPPTLRHAMAALYVAAESSWSRGTRRRENGAARRAGAEKTTLPR